MKWLGALCAALTGLAVAASAHAEAIVPASDDEVIEILPAAASRSEERALLRRLSADPSNAPIAVALARRYVEQARELGDPRFAGRALAVLRAWPDANSAPDDVLLMRATVEQHLHDFDAAALHLEPLLQRRPRHAQALLTLATLRRVQGRYDESDRACAALGSAGALWHARACRAENDGLRGRVETARATLQRLLALPGPDAGARGWLLTTLAELEQRSGRSAEADITFRKALAAQHDGYTVVSYADFLIEQGRHGDALSLLRSEPRSDAVLLRLAIAGSRAEAAQAANDTRELRERMALASMRPELRSAHAREQAMAALWLDEDAPRALALARSNVRLQREPLDLLLLARAARAGGDTAAMAEAAALKKGMGLHDRRLDALL